ncbi:glycosyltransferase [Algoriphagus aquimarinus]|uniref:glycosyltransferase family 2 protein n=1 Tax=Algoriphagus aquimarinus TaxID=237018 RepID=UPI0030DAA58C
MLYNRDKKLKISIVIPTLNRPDKLKNLLGRLALVIDQEELIIVDDSKVAMSKEAIANYSFPINYIHRGEKLGVSSARNLGAAKATGDYLLFFDDDDDFTAEWLSDFRSRFDGNSDLITCDMKIIHENGKEQNVSAKERNYSIVIPGAWVIKKNIFDKVGGFDERLKFAENTELFFRLGQIEKKTEYIEKQNFIYYQSADGGSKNLQNMIDSILIILDKHDSILTDHVKYLYHQIVGVNQMRFKRFAHARKHLWKAYCIKPWKLKTLARLVLSFIPIISMKIYTKQIS